MTAGTQTITAGGGIFGTSNAITVTPSAPYSVVVSAPSGVTAGIAFSVTVSIEDYWGNVETSFSNTVQLSSSDGSATIDGVPLPTSYTFTAADAGTHTFTDVELSTAGGSATGTNQTITATDSTDSLSGSVNVDDYVVSAFNPSDIVVEQINASNNTVAPTGSASPVYLQEFTTGGSNVETVPIFSAKSGSNHPLTLSGTAASEGGLSLSANGADLVLAGYDTAAGGNTQNNSTIGLVSASGAVNTSTTTSLLSGNNTRSAASVDGTSVWVGGNNGVVNEPTGTTLGGTLVATGPNTRELEIAPATVSPTSANQLYASTNKGSLGVQSFSPPLPTATGATSTVLNGMTTSNAPNTYAYFFANPTTMFVADANDGIQEWTLTSGTWSVAATLPGTGGAGTGYVGLTGVQSGSSVYLYATTGTSTAGGRANGNQLISDTFTFNSDNTSGPGTFGGTTVLATAGANDGFAGVAFAPQVASVVPVVTTSGGTTAGSPTSVTVTAQYANGPDVGQTDTGYTGTIAFTSSDPNALLPTNYTFSGANNGVATFSATLKTAGSQTITATDIASDGTGDATVAVSPAALSQLAVSAPVDATAGIAFSVTVTAEDAYGNTIAGYLGTVSFSGGGGGATFPSNYTFVSGDSGSHTFTSGVTLTAGSATGTNETISVTDSGNSVGGSAIVDDYVVSNFNSADLVVEQINAASNTVTPTGAASPVFLSEYNTTGSQSSAQETVPLPSAVTSGPNNPLTLSGTAASEGELSLSANGKYLVLAGYDTAAGGTTQGTSTVGLVNGNGVVDTSTTTTLLSGNNTRGAASVDGSNVWIAGANGVVYETDGTSSGTLVEATPNSLGIEVAPAAVSPTSANTLYASTDKSTLGVQGFSSALPTSSTTTTNTTLTGMYGATAPASYAFFFANPTTMFVADADEGIQEWTLLPATSTSSGGVWSSIASLPGSYVGLTGVQSGNTVSLYATTGTSAAGGRVNGNSLISDTFTFNSGTTGNGTFGTPTTLATAGADDGFAGVSFAPAAATISPPSVTAPVSSGNTFTLGGSNVAVDSGVEVTAGGDASITGATETITNLQTGDTLNFTNQNGITGSYNSGTGVLTLSGSATPGQLPDGLAVGHVLDRPARSRERVPSTSSPTTRTPTPPPAIRRRHRRRGNRRPGRNGFGQHRPDVHPRPIGRARRFGHHGNFRRRRPDGCHRNDHQSANRRYADLQQSERHHRQLQQWYRRADPHRQCNAGQLPNGLAVGHVLLDQHGHRHAHDRRRRHRQQCFRHDQQHGGRYGRRGHLGPGVDRGSRRHRLHRRRNRQDPRLGHHGSVGRYQSDGGHCHDLGRLAADGRYAQLHQPRRQRHHRQLQQWHRHADLEWQFFGRQLSNGLAVGHVRQFDEHRRRQSQHCVRGQRFQRHRQHQQQHGDRNGDSLGTGHGDRGLGQESDLGIVGHGKLLRLSGQPQPRQCHAGLRLENRSQPDDRHSLGQHHHDQRVLQRTGQRHRHRLAETGRWHRRWWRCGSQWRYRHGLCQ